MKIRNNAHIKFTVSCELTEAEARALDALAGYGLDPFLETFYKEMGRSYLEPYEQGLRTLFKKIRDDVLPALSEVDAARRALKQYTTAPGKRQGN